MKVIYKYPLELTDSQYLKVPSDSEFLHVSEQHGKLCLWSLVDPDSTPGAVLIEVIGTGNTIPEPEANRTYIGTAHISQFVWHVFWRES